MGRRTSVYLDDDLAAVVAASGVPLAELIRRGLGLAEAAPGAAVLVPVAADARMPEGVAAVVSGADAGVLPPAPRARGPKRAGQCPPHPPGRVVKGLCGACGTGGL